MILKSYSFSSDDRRSSAFISQVYNEIRDLHFYFVHFNGRYTDDAESNTFLHVLWHYDKNCGTSLKAYIKGLARSIGKKKNKEVAFDFLEDIVTEQNQLMDIKNDNTNARVFLNKVPDFTNKIIFDLERDSDERIAIIKLALHFMEKYVILCNVLEKHDTSEVYFPDIFKKECIKISEEYDDFHDACISLYHEFEGSFNYFISLDDNNIGEWRIADFSFINTNMSKRVKLINVATNQEVVDADSEACYLKGSIGDKCILKVNYKDLYDLMCNLAKSDDVNEIKFLIDDYFIIKTFGGSYSLINPIMTNIFELFKVEILTNIIKDLNGKIINIGSENVYVLCSPNSIKKLNTERYVRGHNITFKYDRLNLEALCR